MTPYRVRSLEDAFIYIADCNLATVSSMAMLKSRKKLEFKRQIDIAQYMVDWAVRFGIDVKDTRVDGIIKHHDANVSKWVEQYINNG